MNAIALLLTTACPVWAEPASASEEVARLIRQLRRLGAADAAQIVEAARREAAADLPPADPVV